MLGLVLRRERAISSVRSRVRSPSTLLLLLLLLLLLRLLLPLTLHLPSLELLLLRRTGCVSRWSAMPRPASLGPFPPFPAPRSDGLVLGEEAPTLPRYPVAVARFAALCRSPLLLPLLEPPPPP
jgi:hypothetical protein